MISGTVSLYLGTEGIVQAQYPADLNVRVNYTPDGEEGEQPFDPEAMQACQIGFFESRGVAAKSVGSCRELGFGAGLLPDGSYTTDRFTEGTVAGVVSITCVTADYYEKVSGEHLDLAAGEAAAFGLKGDALTLRWTVPNEGTELGQSTYKIVRHLRENPRPGPAIAQMVTLVVADEQALEELYQNQKLAYGDSASYLVWYGYIDLDCSEDRMLELEENYNSACIEENLLDGTGSWKTCRWEMRAVESQFIYGMSSGFLFLGIFLGFIFLMATVLIIYYKQVSEGYEDKERFEIMQKVGLSREEVKQSIRSQILLVFFLPIVVASIHILFDFNMVMKLLTLFYLDHITLTALCTLGTVLVFFLAYGAVYMVTARTYYKIVER